MHTVCTVSVHTDLAHKTLRCGRVVLYCLLTVLLVAWFSVRIKVMKGNSGVLGLL
jgi:hypothetical protein